jgi:hypothetical protein
MERDLNRHLTTAELETAFERAEGTLRLEGLTTTPFFQTVKARVISGDISIDEAKAEIKAHHAAKALAARQGYVTA